MGTADLRWAEGPCVKPALWGSLAVNEMVVLVLTLGFLAPVAGCGDRCHHGCRVAWAHHPTLLVSFFLLEVLGRTRPVLQVLRSLSRSGPGSLAVVLWWPGSSAPHGSAEPLSGGCPAAFPLGLLHLQASLTSPEPACFCFLFLRLHK